MVEDFHRVGGMGESRHMEEEKPKISDDWNRHFKHIFQDKTQGKVDTHKFTQA